MGGTTDDWAAGGRLATLLADTAVREIVFDGGATYLCKSVQDIRALRGAQPIHLTGNGAAIVSSLAGTGAGMAANCVWFATKEDISTTTLAADTVVGALTISTAASVAAGTVVSVETASGGWQRTVLAVAGAGPYTLTLDEPLWRIIPSGSTVRRITPPTGIVIDDFTISGSGDRALELEGAYRCIYSRIVVPAGCTFDGPIASFDIPSRDCYYDDCNIVAVTNTIGMFIEHGTRCRMLRSKVQGGIAFDASEYCEANDVHTISAGVGYAAAAVPGCHIHSESALDVDACVGIKVVGCTFTNGEDQGLLAYNARDTVVENTEGSFNGNIGLSVQFGNASLSRCRAKSNTLGGIAANNSSVVKVSQSETANNSAFGTKCMGTSTMFVTDLQSTQDAVCGLWASGTLMDVRGFKLNTTLNDGAYSGLLLDAGICFARGLNLTMVNSSVPIKSDGAGTKLFVSDVTVAGCWYPLAVTTAASTTQVWFGTGLNFSGAALAPLDDTTGDKAFSKQTATLVAGTKEVLFSGATAYSRWRVTRKTIGGTAGNLTFVPAAGKVTINSDNAADTSVVIVECIDNDAA